MRIAVIGGGISGIASANVLQRCGHDVTVFESSSNIGGQWNVTYPGVRLQNVGVMYRLYQSSYTDGLHLNEQPSAAKILRHIRHTAAINNLHVLTGHTVLSMVQRRDERASSAVTNDSGHQGWLLDVLGKDRNQRTTRMKHAFDRVVIATGQYSTRESISKFSGTDVGADRFKGTIHIGRDLSPQDVEQLKGKRVAVVGFGKTAVDVAAMLSSPTSQDCTDPPHCAQVHHVFRRAHWLLPTYIFGTHYTEILFARHATTPIPSWGHASALARFVHGSTLLRYLLIEPFWMFLTIVVFVHSWVAALRQTGIRTSLSKQGRQRMGAVLPQHWLVTDLRSAAALEADAYFGNVTSGAITPHPSSVSSFRPDGLELSNGKRIRADSVVLCTGSPTPQFPFLPEDLRSKLEAENARSDGSSDGIQLFRHVIHPDVPNVAFAGFNHGFLHVQMVEIGTIWADAYFRGAIITPSRKEMLDCIKRVRDWKRKHISSENSLLCGVNTRFHQYIDTLLQDLDITVYRKESMFKEIVERYTADDYDGVVEEYLAHGRSKQFETGNVDM